MKKILLLLTLTFLNSISSQVLKSENFNALTIGNVNTVFSNTVSGQGGYYTFVPTPASASNSDFQIVNEDVTYENVLQITGSDIGSNSRTLWKDGLNTAWTSRTIGNDIIQVEYDFFTGPITTSKNQIRMVIYDAATSTKMLAGLQMNQDTKIIKGLSYFNDGGTLGNYNFDVAPSPVVLPANTWVRVGFAFNKTTGQVTWKGPGFNKTITGNAAGDDPNVLFYILASGGSTNVMSSTTKFDNVEVKAVATESILNAQSVSLLEKSFVIYPNPITNYISIKSNNYQFDAISISDSNGRIIKSFVFDSILETNFNVSEFSSGIYFLKITTSEGVLDKKIIKN